MKEENRIFIEIYNQYYNKLYAYLKSICKNSEIAQDLVHDIFIKLWEEKTIYKQIKCLEQYIFRMARNLAYNLLSRKRHENEILSSIQTTYEERKKHPEPIITELEIQEKVQNIITQLTPKQQLIYKLSRNNKLKHKEIAQILNISVSTVNNHLTNITRIIKNEITK